MPTRVPKALFLAVPVAFVAMACDGPIGELLGKSDDPPAVASAAVTSSAAAAASAAAPLPSGSATGARAPTASRDNGGPVVRIPGGAFRAGSSCSHVPRDTTREPAWTNTEIGEVAIDAYPYPNEPGKPALTGLTQSEAADKCEARGKRLCAELEWERACKGPDNKQYPWGARYTDACKGGDSKLGARDGCKSGFEVFDQNGVVREWTSSPWQRGTGPANSVVVKGSSTKGVGWKRSRCANVEFAQPTASADDIGFRCCSGVGEVPQVAMKQERGAPLKRIISPDSVLLKALIKALPKSRRPRSKFQVKLDRLQHWRPVANEELLVARWSGSLAGAEKRYAVVVFNQCGGRPWRLSRMEVSAEVLKSAHTGKNRSTLEFKVEDGGRTGTLKVRYHDGVVKLSPPPWLGTNQRVSKPGPNVKKIRLRKK